MSVAQTQSVDELGSLQNVLSSALEPLRYELSDHSALAAGLARELRALEDVRSRSETLLRQRSAHGAAHPHGRRQAAATEELRYSLARVRRLTDCMDQLRPHVRREGAQLNLGERVARRVDSLGPAIAARGLELATRLPRAIARGDVVLLGRVVDELIDNAVLHNVPGGWLELGMETLGNRVLLRAANGGRQISADEARTLCDPFRRLHPELPGGLGLGLTLVKRIVAAHGGSTWICAPLSGGLAVEIDLPGEAEMLLASRPRRRDATCGRP